MLTCRHDDLVAVETMSEPEPVAYICTGCWDSFEPDSGVAKGWLAHERKLELRRRADREFAEMFMERDAGKVAQMEAAQRKAELAAEANRAGRLSDESANDIINRTSEVFSTGYQASEWDKAR